MTYHINGDEKKRLLRAQLAHALADCEALLIQLGNAYLQRSEATRHTLEAFPYAGLTHEGAQSKSKIVTAAAVVTKRKPGRPRKNSLAPTPVAEALKAAVTHRPL